MFFLLLLAALTRQIHTKANTFTLNIKCCLLLPRQLCSFRRLNCVLCWLWPSLCAGFVSFNFIFFLALQLGHYRLFISRQFNKISQHNFPLPFDWNSISFIWFLYCSVFIHIYIYIHILYTYRQIDVLSALTYESNKHINIHTYIHTEEHSKATRPLI